MYNKTPLRYPGGKAKIAPFVRSLFEMNGFCDGQYIEPYAGGAGVAVDLLISEYAREIHLNDASYPVYCFWHALLHTPEYLCRRLSDVRVTPATWTRQRNIMRDSKGRAPHEIGFAFLFLNRTNRSGIISGGMIGGKEQTGAWLIDARFYREEMIRRIRLISDYAHRISIYCMDAECFIADVVNNLTGKCCVYFDPPYYVAGQRLYLNTYQPEDHARIANLIQYKTRHPWFLTYDDHPAIRKLYADRRRISFELRYSASSSHAGTESMFFSDDLKIPKGILKPIAIDPSGARTRRSGVRKISIVA